MVTNTARAFDHDVDITGMKPLPGTPDERREGKKDMFGAIFNSVLSNVNTTNGYLSKAENEEIKLAMGQSESAHDLAVALQKASVSLQYTVAVKNQFMDAYRQIMQMQI